MKNVKMAVQGKILTIEVDLGQRHGLSKSEKSMTVASTEGNVAVEGHPEIKIGLNIFTPAPTKG